MHMISASVTPQSLPLRLAPLSQAPGKRKGDAVYVAAVPLRAAPGPAQLAVSAAYSLGVWDLQHFMVVIKSQSYQSPVTVFDFQPQEPRSMAVALAALSLKPVPGIILKRSLAKIPRNRCWFVGFSCADGIDVADTFNGSWCTDLIVGRRDCRHYTNGLVESLTGKNDILDHLKDAFHG